MGDSSLYIGLMSGTSLDGADAVLVDFSQAAPRAQASAHIKFAPELRAELLALNRPGNNEIARGALAANQVVDAYAQAVRSVLAQSDLAADAIAAIGCHGQTVRHRPDLGFTVQLNNPALLAEMTGIRVVADFRSRDLAAGGQGAPLVPAFHAAAFSHPSVHRVIVNIGGIANLTDLPPRGRVVGFDCGPGNLLMDAWCQRHLGQPYDDDGAWAASGRASPALLGTLLAEPYFGLPPPKSTGRDLFSLAWLEARLQPDLAPRDVQATLLQLTVASIHRAIRDCCYGAEEIYVCGGGARNHALLAALQRVFAEQRVTLAATDALGTPAEQVEALAFAWLAQQAILGKAGNLPAVTGARHECVLGAIYPV